MSASRWVWVGISVVAVAGALAAALLLGGGPASRAGWEAAGWVAGVLAALVPLVLVVRWALADGRNPETPERRDSGAGAVTNTVTGHVSGTLIQGRDFHGDITAGSYGGDHVDFRGGTFHGPVTGRSTPPAPSDDGETPDRRP
ncbi:hypothetical protein NI17_005055 [Thermobifida halotolerans]|uniref:Uncharacterized protein n=1 Tax=Thermobifida halotolerans TaxID=483545 RepID=A0A399G949_9ACTN|nr:hypothetical protein [Thermobifida halotolerans]UOE20588.1 hypothetical protein NI17_005055 [Thermobifida halotolerans]